MKRALIILSLLVTVILGVRFGLLTDANIARFTLNWLSENMARQLQVDGSIAVEWGNPVLLRAQSVRLANPEWAQNADMATADEVVAGIDLTTLIGDEPLLITELTIRNVVGELVSNEDGQANWQFGREDSQGNNNFLIKDLDVTNASLQVRRPGFKAVDFEIESLRQVENAEGLLQTTLVGQYNKRPVDASGLVGPFKNLLIGENIRIALSTSIGSLQINGSGTIDDLDNPRQPKLKIEIVAPDAVEVAAMLGIKFDRPSDIKLELEIAPEDTGVRFDGGGRWATTNLNVQGYARDLPALDGIELKATGDGESLRQALRLFGFATAPDKPFSFSGDLSRTGQNLDVRELELKLGNFLLQLNGDMNQFPSLNDANLKLKAEGPDVVAFRDALGIPGLAEGDYFLEAELGRSPEGKDVFRGRARTDLGKATVNGTLTTAPGYVGTTASLRAEGQRLGPLADLVLLRELREKPFAVQADVVIVPAGYRISDANLSAGASRIDTEGLVTSDPRLVGTELSWTLTDINVADVGRSYAPEKAWPDRQASASGKTLVRPDDFVLTNVTGTLGEAKFVAGGQLGRAANYRGTDIRLSLSGPDLERLAFLVDDMNLPGGPFELAGRIQRTAAGIRISESRLDVAGATGKADIELALPTEPLNAKFDIEISGPDATAFWEKRYAIELGAEPFTIDLRGELTQDILQLDDGVLNLGENIVQATGTIRRGQADNAIQIRASSPKIASIATVAGIDLFPGRNLDLAGTLRRRGEHFRFENFLARTNEGDLAGTIDFLPGEPPQIKAELTSQRLDITWLTDPVNDRLLEEQVEEKEPEGGDGRLIPDWPLPLDELRLFNLDLTISADEILREQRDVRNAYGRIVVEDGALAFDPYRFGGGSGTLEASLHLRPVDDTAEVHFKVQAKDLVSGLFQPDGADLSFAPKGDWEIDVRTRGKTLRELAANLNGTGQLSSKSGRLPNAGGTGVVFGDLISSIARAVNPFAEREPFTEISCSVFPFVFENGDMSTAPSVVVQTDKLNIISRGDVDLKTERLDMSFNSRPRRGLGVSAGSLVNPFVRIGGTMADPSVALDTTGAILTGGAAFFTAGLSLIAKAAFDAAWRSPDPCGRVLEQADKRFKKANRD